MAKRKLDRVFIGKELKDGTHTIRVNGVPFKGCRVVNWSYNTTYEPQYNGWDLAKYIVIADATELSFQTTGGCTVTLKGHFFVKAARGVF